MVGRAGAKPRRAKTCAEPGCHNIFGVVTIKRFCSEDCAYAHAKRRIARSKFRIIPCRHPECCNLFRPAKAQRYCCVACRRDDRKCSTCGDRIPDDQPGTKNDYCRLCERVKKYGIDASDYKRLLADQSERCRICSREHGDGVRGGMDGPLVVDHCHDSGVVRGLLCAQCNMAIGLLGDDPATAQAAAEYLRPHKKEGWG